MDNEPKATDDTEVKDEETADEAGTEAAESEDEKTEEEERDQAPDAKQETAGDGHLKVVITL